MVEIIYKALGPYSAVLREQGKDPWIYGFPVHKTSHYGKEVDGWYITASEDALAEFQNTEEIFPYTMCRYIGIKDKNGSGIFENDIIKTKYGRLCVVVAFCSNCFVGIDLKAIETEENLGKKAPNKYDLWESNNLEVIGNVFDDE